MGRGPPHRECHAARFALKRQNKDGNHRPIQEQDEHNKERGVSDRSFEFDGLLPRYPHAEVPRPDVKDETSIERGWSDTTHGLPLGRSREE